MGQEDQKLSQLTEATALQTRILLLVEDNLADAELVREMLDTGSGDTNYDVQHVSMLSEARDLLTSGRVDVILLDLRLPDAVGVEAVKSIQALSEETPIIVLTGMEDEALALQCIDAGAQDYLSKDELKPRLLRRTIGYAVARLREAQLREMQTLLSRYRALSSSGSRTSVTASVAGVGSMRDGDPMMFERLVADYGDLLEKYIEQLTYKKDRPNDLMGRISSAIGDAGGGPRDLLDLHVASLELAVQGVTMERGRAIVLEGRLLALEMMGLLVDYYRTGTRRRFTFGDPR